MTLKEKFKEILTAFWINDWEDECEKIADEFAIGFADFIERIKDADIDSLDYHFYLNYTTKELLEMFKKEKGL